MARKKKSSAGKPTRKKGGKAETKPVDEQVDRFRNVLEYISPEFIEEGARRIRREDVHEVVRRASTVRKQFRAGEVLDRFRAESFVMLDMLRDFDSGSYGEAPLWAVSVGTFVLQYVLKPIDIIPDTLPVVGQLDDALVLSQGLVLVRKELHAYKVWKLATATRGV